MTGGCWCEICNLCHRFRICCCASMANASQWDHTWGWNVIQNCLLLASRSHVRSNASVHLSGSFGLDLQGAVLSLLVTWPIGLSREPLKPMFPQMHFSFIFSILSKHYNIICLKLLERNESCWTKIRQDMRSHGRAQWLSSAQREPPGAEADVHHALNHRGTRTKTLDDSDWKSPGSIFHEQLHFFG